MRHIEGLSLEGKALEDRLWNQAHNNHDVTPQSRRVEHVTRSAFKTADDVARDPAWIGEVRAARQLIGHWCAYRSWLDGEHANARAMSAVNTTRAR